MQDILAHFNGKTRIDPTKGQVNVGHAPVLATVTTITMTCVTVTTAVGGEVAPRRPAR